MVFECLLGILCKAPFFGKPSNKELSWWVVALLAFLVISNISHLVETSSHPQQLEWVVFISLVVIWVHLSINTKTWIQSTLKSIAMITLNNYFLLCWHWQVNQTKQNLLTFLQSHKSKQSCEDHPDPRVQPRTFVGLSIEDVLHWLDHFENVASYHQWNDACRALEVCTSLDGIAAT